MKRNIILIGIMAMFFIAAISSCRKGTTGPIGETGAAGAAGAAGATGAVGDLQKGNITGFVSYVLSEWSTEVHNRSGFTVSLEGTSLTATTDIYGKFTFSDVVIGTYNLRVSKDGYGDVVKYGLTVAPAGTLLVSEIMIGAKSTNQALVLRIYNPQWNVTNMYRYFDFQVDESDGNGTVRYFVSTSADVSCTNYAYTFASSESGRVELPLGWFPKGTTIYVVAHGYSDDGYLIEYRDETTGLMIYPMINGTPSNVVSYTLVDYPSVP